MSGVYIKGMEMPKEGNWKTIRIYPSGECAVPNWQGDCTLIKDAVAVPVPDHGRLIDADALITVFREMESIDWNNKAAPYSWAYAYESIEDDIDNAPTIIPADKEEGDNDL